MKKTPEQLCLEDISKLQKKFRSLEQITYIEEVRNWSTDNGFNIRQSDVEITAEKDGKTINLTPEQLKGKEWTFGPEDFKKIESGQKSTKEKMLYILKNRTNKEKKIEESETNSEN